MKRGTPEHPKISEFAALLKLPRYAAIGILECLWHFTAEYAPQGDIGKHSDKAIAEACYWHGEPGRFVKALVAARLLVESDDHRLLVWDWHDHADDYTRKKLQRKHLAFLTVQTSPDKNRLPLPVPMPKPEPVPKPPPADPPRTNERNPPGYALDELWAEFRASAAWTSWIEGDFREAWLEWCALDSEQRLAAIEGIRGQAIWRGPQFVPGPKKWLVKREWQRRAPPDRQQSKVAAMLEGL